MNKTAKPKSYFLPSLLIRIFALSAASAVFIYYAVSNFGKYRWYSFIPPFLAIFGFAAVIIAAAPRFAALFAGDNDFSPIEIDKPKHLYVSFAKVCAAALVLHVITFVIGVLIFTFVKEGRLLPVPTSYWRQAWMKSNTDAGHYINIAENWYQATGKDDVLLVFFPMLPILIRVFNFIFRDSFISALFINSTAVTLSSGMIFLTLLPIMGTKRSKRAAILALLLPGAIFLNSPMTEPLFILFSVCGFYFLGKKNYLLAGFFTALAGFTRSLGVLLAVPIALIGINQLIAFFRKKDKFPLLVIPGLIISVLGTLGYLYINYRIHGDPLKFFEFQKSNWHQEACPFYDTTRYMFRYFVSYYKTDKAGFVSLWLPQVIAVFGSLAFMAPKARKLPASYTAYFLCYFAVSVGCTWLLSSVRYLSAAFPIIAALGIACSNRLKTALLTLLLAAVYVIYTIMYMQRIGIY